MTPDICEPGSVEQKALVRILLPVLSDEFPRDVTFPVPVVGLLTGLIQNRTIRS
jgi:hypothetical protein